MVAPAERKTVDAMKAKNTLPTISQGGWTEENDKEGINNIIIYFAQAPGGMMEIPGPFRIAHIVVQYIQPDFREPSDTVINILDEEFVSNM